MQSGEMPLEANVVEYSEKSLGLVIMQDKGGAIMVKEKRRRVLMSKSALDAHDKGIRYIAQLLRDAGAEVIFTRYYTIDEVISQAADEDVDVIALSFYGSGLMYDCQELLNLKKKRGMDEVLFIVGGTIVDDEKDKLLKMGVDRVFQPNVGTVDDVVNFVCHPFQG